MSKEAKNPLDSIKGLKKVDPKELAEFRKDMGKNIVPRIVEKVEARRLRAAKSRNRRLKQRSV